ncbi:MAG: ATP citrate synthase [Deltaproteobacteria bacterium]|nr:ATP citrate synthase [Deltaproteobacteria bacterium]
MESYKLFDISTTAFIYGSQTVAIQRMLDFDYLCRREQPSVTGMITPDRGGFEKFFMGSKEITINRYRSIQEAAAAHPETDVLVNFASQRAAYRVSREALDASTIRTIVIIAEGVPERFSRILAALAREKGKWIIGPATVGGIVPGAFKVADAAGTPENVVESKLYRRGSVGFVSKSGGLSNESYNIIARNSDGIYEGVAVGGDLYPGSTLLDHLLRYEANPDIKMMVCLSEVGGRDEYAIIDAVKDGRLTKPLVMWVTGTCAKAMPKGVQFGHAGARAGSTAETAEAKNQALRKAGVTVPDSFDDYGDKIRETYEALVKKGTIRPVPEIEPRRVPMDLKQALREGLVRRPTNFISTICDERGDVHNYCGVPITDIIQEGYGIGGVIGLLWFKKKLPRYVGEFIEMVLQIVADHGPAVSGALNTIVTARAGKGLIESVMAGILTIGPRFGGAVNGAAEHFRYGYTKGMSARELVDDMGRRNIMIQGIGHRIRSVENPDPRVQIMMDFARKHFKTHPLLDYALEVQAVTTLKRGTLILNVDGAIGVLFVDMLTNLGFSNDEIDEAIGMGVFNAFFILGRMIGFMGHYFDQKRMKQPLYRHPQDDILYAVPDHPEEVQ